MAASDTVIANLAITHLGIGKTIENLTSERSTEAVACKRYFEETRKRVLRDFPWPFATAIETLNLVAEDPNEEWNYSYRYPSNCLMIRKLQSGIRNDTRQSRVPYRVSRDTSGLLILTDEQNAIIEYTFDEQDYARYPSDCIMAFSVMLAVYIAPALTRGDLFKIRSELLQIYQLEMSNAKANAVIEEQDDEVVDSEFIRERE